MIDKIPDKRKDGKSRFRELVSYCKDPPAQAAHMLGKIYCIDDPDTKAQLTNIVKKITIAYNGDPRLKELIADSAVYSILSRRGLDTGEMPGALAHVAELPELKEPEGISKLGIAVDEVAEGILHNIERTVKNVDCRPLVAAEGKRKGREFWRN